MPRFPETADWNPLPCSHHSGSEGPPQLSGIHHPRNCREAASWGQTELQARAQGALLGVCSLCRVPPVGVGRLSGPSDSGDKSKCVSLSRTGDLGDPPQDVQLNVSMTEQREPCSKRHKTSTPNQPGYQIPEELLAIGSPSWAST